jgi:hypothetical protein
MEELRNNLYYEWGNQNDDMFKKNDGTFGKLKT